MKRKHVHIQYPHAMGPGEFIVIDEHDGVIDYEEDPQNTFDTDANDGLWSKAQLEQFISALKTLAATHNALFVHDEQYCENGEPIPIDDWERVYRADAEENCV